MIEEIVKQFLDDHLSVPSFTDRQNKMPKRYVMIDKTGSSKSNHLPSSTLAFQSYAESKYEAAKINQELKEVVESMIELDVIRGVHLNSDYDYTDTTTKEYRYQAVFDINYY